MKDVILKNAIVHIVAFLVTALFIGLASGGVSYDGECITDYNGYRYCILQDGMYEMQYGEKITRFGFGITGIYQGQPFTKMSTDFSWDKSIQAIPSGYFVSLNTSSWFTNVTFTNSRTKISNHITNTLPNSINKGKFWYLLEIDETETVDNGKVRVEWDAKDSNFSNLTIQDNVRIVLNDDLEFNTGDILKDGFRLTNITIVNASDLGFDSSKRVIAIGFTKGTGTLTSGQSITIDPEITASNDTQYSNDSAVFTTSTTGEIVKEIVVTEDYTGSWRITFNATCTDCVAMEDMGYWVIYKNDVFWGIQHSTDSEATVTFSEDFSPLNILNGDKIQIYSWLQTGDGIAYTSGFRIKFDIVEGEPTPTPTQTPYNGSAVWNLTNPFNGTNATSVYYWHGEIIISLLILITICQVFTVIIITYNFVDRIFGGRRRR